ncbi:MAG TPA: hypothetical protein VHR72_09425 [Gemmataceae bacterium]|nr:hypothetical protein [Gemmataceae bacterium]
MKAFFAIACVASLFLTGTTFAGPDSSESGTTASSHRNTRNLGGDRGNHRGHNGRGHNGHGHNGHGHNGRGHNGRGHNGRGHNGHNHHGHNQHGRR